jgi:bifunctional non-homologous end joining protein LigD
VKLTHPEKILDAKSKLTKRDLARYYQKVAPKLLPLVADRPLMLLRCPQAAGKTGQKKSCFVQKHAVAGTPRELKVIQVPEENHKARGIAVDSEQGLEALAQLGVMELHSWEARIQDLESPDYFVLDLDPDPSLKWKDVVKAAEDLRGVLKESGLESFAKLSGSKGIHVVVPLDGDNSWDEVKEFTHNIAQNFERRDPKRYVSAAGPSRRKGRIYIDYLRNARGATSVVPYSPRAHDGAPVAMPLSWAELKKSRGPQDFTVQKLLKRRSIPDPWKDFFRKRQKLPH